MPIRPRFLIGYRNFGTYQIKDLSHLLLLTSMLQRQGPVAQLVRALVL